MRDLMRTRLFALLAVTTFIGSAISSSADEKSAIKKEKLQIVFLFGQSNMVGLADARTAWYMTQPQYAPPREMAVKKSRYCDCALCDVGGLNNRSLLRILFCRLHR